MPERFGESIAIGVEPAAEDRSAESEAPFGEQPIEQTPEVRPERAVFGIETEAADMFDRTDREIAAATASVGVSVEEARRVFVESGTADRIEALHERIRAILAEAKGKLSEFLHEQPTDLTAVRDAIFSIHYSHPSHLKHSEKARFVNNNLDVVSTALRDDTTAQEAFEIYQTIVHEASFERSMAAGENFFSRVSKLQQQFRVTIDETKVAQVLSDNIESIDHLLEREDVPKGEMIKGLQTLLDAKFLPNPVKEELKGVLERHFTDLRTAAVAWPGTFCRFAELIAAHGTPEQMAAVEGDLRTAAQVVGPEHGISNAVLAFSKSKIPAVQEMAVKCVAPLLEPFGVDGEKTVHAWFVSGESEKMDEILRNNLAALQRLEQARPGAAKTLQEQFGIADFARYPTEILIQQVEEVNDVDKPYGIALLPRDDWNGGFYHNKKMFSHLYEGLQGKQGLRILECQSKIDIARRLIELDRRYGQERKIQFALLGAHGDAESMQFGNAAQARDLLTMRDLVGAGVRRAGSFFAKGAPFILESCKTGARAGIGQEISRQLDVKIVAPDRNSSLDDIEVLFRDDQPEFFPKYSTRKGSVGVKVFVEGKQA